MCYKLIEKHTCNHTEEHSIPCEGSLIHEKCDAPPEACQDKINDIPDPCRKCKADDDDAAALAHALKQIAEDPALAAEPRTAVQPAAGTFGFFKQRTKWSFCGHYDSPKELDIERFAANDPIWLDHEEQGSCHGCCKTPDSLLKAMRANGELDGEDPWGALDKPVTAAAGGSGSSNAHAKPYGGDLGGRHPALASSPYDEEEEYVPPTRSSSPDQPATLTKKGKGRAGRPEETYTSRFGPAEPVETDSEHEGPTHSGDEDEEHVFRAPRDKAPKYGSDDDDDDDDDDSHSEEDGAVPVRGRRTGRHLEDDSSEGSPKEGLHHRARSSSSKYSQEDDRDDDSVTDYDAPPPGGPPPGKPARGRVLPAVDEED